MIRPLRRELPDSSCNLSTLGYALFTEPPGNSSRSPTRRTAGRGQHTPATRAAKCKPLSRRSRWRRRAPLRACCIMPALTHLILTHIILLRALAQLPLHNSSLSASFHTSSLAHLLSYVSPQTSALTLLTFTRLTLPNITLKRKPHTPCPHTPRLRAHLALTRTPSHTSASHALPVQASLFFRVSSKTGLPMPPPRDEASRYQPDVTSCSVTSSLHLSPLVPTACHSPLSSLQVSPPSLPKILNSVSSLSSAIRASRLPLLHLSPLPSLLVSPPSLPTFLYVLQSSTSSPILLI